MTRLYKWRFGKARFALLALGLLAFCALTAILLWEGRSPAEEAQKYYEHGAKLLEQRDYVKASIELRNAVRLKSDLLPAWHSLAQIDEATKNWPHLIARLQSIVSLDPSDTEARIKLARLLLFSGSVREALAATNMSNEAESRNGRLLGIKAAILYRLNYPVKAVQQAQDALGIEPNNPDALMVLAVDRLAKDEPKEALRLLERPAPNTPEYLQIHLLKLKIFDQLGESQQFESLLRSLMLLHPREGSFRRRLIKFYVDHHREDDAETEIRNLITTNPGDPKAELDLVGLLYSSKGPMAAKQELVARINAGGDVFALQIALAELNFSQGNFADSEQLLHNLATSADSSEKAVAAQVKLAEMYIKLDRLDAASALISEVLRKDSHNTSGLKLSAAVRLARGQLDSATTDLRLALNNQPQSTELMLLLAGTYERVGSIAEADKLYSDAVKVSNFDPVVGLSYVRFLERRGSRDRAETILAQLSSRWPKNLNILSALADDKLKGQDWEKAKEVAERIRNAGDTRGIADHVLGAALIGQQKYDDSIAVFQRAAAASPSAVQPMISLVGALVRAQKTDQAMSLLKSTLQSDPENAEARVLMGKILLETGVPDEALKSFESAVEKQPKNVVGYQALAKLYVGQKQYDEAFEVIRSGLRMLPNNMILHFALAEAFEKTQQYEAAITEYEFMLSQQPGSMVLANNLAGLLADHRDDKDSLERAASLAKNLRNSPVPQFEDTLGWISYRQGDYRTALSLLEHAAATLPDSALVHYHLGMTYLVAMRTTEAAKQLKAAQSLAPDSHLEEEIVSALKNLPS